MATDTTQKVSVSTKAIVISFIVIVILVAVLFYIKGRKTVTIAKLPTDPGGNATAASEGEISRIATALYNDMNGFNWFFSHSTAPYSDALTLSDTDFVKLYNFFNTKYQKESGETLVGWMNAENVLPTDSIYTLMGQMNSRFGKLNLK